MSHANAILSRKGRLLLARFRVEDGATIRHAAERFQVSTTTVTRWASRYRQVLAEGRQPTLADMADRLSRPRYSPGRTHPRTERKIVRLRARKRLGPVEIGHRLGVPPSTVHAVLMRRGLNRLSQLDQATGVKIRAEAPRRYERANPGDLVHLDVKKAARIPDGGPVHKTATGQRIGGKRRRYKPGRGGRKQGYVFLHSAIDDHSRLAYTEALNDETAATAAAFWRRARAFFTSHGITVHEVLTDNGPCYVGHPFTGQLAAQGIKHRRTRPYRPQTNGKVERFHRTLMHSWIYGKPWTSESARQAALTSWLRTYNHYRPHTALERRPPISRIPQPRAA